MPLPYDFFGLCPSPVAPFSCWLAGFYPFWLLRGITVACVRYSLVLDITSSVVDRCALMEGKKVRRGDRR
eukprot:8863125-Alexandrium_andersonii.AAC.1